MKEGDDDHKTGERSADEIAAELAKAKEEALEAGKNKNLPFNEEQQQRVNDLLDSAHKRGFAAGGKSYTEKVANLEKELKAAGEKTGTQGVNLEEMQKEMSSLKDILAKGQERTVTAALVTAIGPHNVHKPEQVAELLRSQIHVDADGNLTVQDSTGALKVNKDGKAMSVDEAIDTWLAENPHYKKAAGGPGAGSKAGEFQEKGEGKTITRKEFDSLPQAEQSKVGRDKDIKITD